MTSVVTVKSNFTAGEVAEHLLGRSDLAAYHNGARRLRNCVILPTGGVRRRPGSRRLSEIGTPARLIPFEFNTEQTYLLVLTHYEMAVYRDGALLDAGIVTPWPNQDLPHLSWTQSADTLLIVTPNRYPHRVTRDAYEYWSVRPWTFATHVSGRIQMPHHKFVDDAVTLKASATTGNIQITASAAVFTQDHRFAQFRLDDREVRITAVSHSGLAQATVLESLKSTQPTRDWTEPAFSAARGYPATCAFHQDRLVIGGSRDLPNQIWMSKTSDLFNFDLGEGLDDEAISFAVLSDQVNAIRGVFSSRHLQVFTSGSEWMVTGEPLTPASIQLRRQTRIGSRSDRIIPPSDVDGATIFVAKTGRQLREFLFADVEQAYQAGDLGLLSEHLLDDLVGLTVDAERRLVHAVRGDGKLATVTMYRSEQVTAWSLSETEGRFLDAQTVGGVTYLLVERAEGIGLEAFDDTVLLDGVRTLFADPPSAEWTGLDALNGQTVWVITDGNDLGTATIEDGRMVLPQPAARVEIGLPFTVMVEPLPPALAATGASVGSGPPLRIVRATFRVAGTQSLRVDVGQGFREIIPGASPPTHSSASGDESQAAGSGGPAAHADDPPDPGLSISDPVPEPITGDVTVRALGWKTEAMTPLWRIEQRAPRRFSLLSVTLDLKVNR